MNSLIIVRGGGDIASGVIQKLYRCGYTLLILEIDKPTSVRKTVCYGEAIYQGKFTLENITSTHCQTMDDIKKAWIKKEIPVVVDPKGEYITKLKPFCVIDAILAKKNIGTNKEMAPITIGLGPGFIAGKDVNIVVETKRGHQLGRLIFEGKAEVNTGEPGEILGYTYQRVLRAPSDGRIEPFYKIGDYIDKGAKVAIVGDKPVYAEISGILRGMIEKDLYVKKGLKIGDIDPRIDEVENFSTISDKARAIGGAVLEAILILQQK